MTTLLQNDQSLIGACSIFGSPLRTYDDSYDPIDSTYLYRDADGLTGLVRASTWEDAYECVVDEILPTVSEEDIHEAYGFYIYRTDSARWALVDDTITDRDSRSLCLGMYASRQAAQDKAVELAQHYGRELVEGYQYQSNATGTGIVRTCLNGEDMRPTTRDELREMGIVLILETDD